jgi:hypothetical protein
MFDATEEVPLHLREINVSFKSIYLKTGLTGTNLELVLN